MKSSMKCITKAFFIMLFAVLLSVPLSSCSSAEKTPESPVSYTGVQIRMKTDNPGIRSLYAVDLEAVKALEAQGYTVEYGAVFAYAPAGGTVSTSRDLTVTRNSNGYTANVSSAEAVCIYSTANAFYATNKFVSVSEKTAAFAYTVIFTPEYQTRENYNACFVVLGFCHIMNKNGETVAMHYSYGEGEHFGMESSTYGKTVSLYKLTRHWVSRDNEESTEEIRSNANLVKVLAELTEKTASVTFDTPRALSKGASTEELTLSNMREGIYKVTVGYTASAEAYQKLSYNDRAVVQKIAAGTNAKKDVFYVHLKQGDNKVSFTAQAGAITLNSLTFTMVETLSSKNTAVSASVAADLESTGTAANKEIQYGHTFYRLRNSSLALRFYDMKPGRYNVYAIGSTTGKTSLTLRSVVGTADDGGETLTTVTTSFELMGSGSSGSGGGYFSLGTVELYEGGNTLHIASESSIGANVLLSEIILVPATYTVTYRDVNDKLVSVQELAYGEIPVRPAFEIPEGYSISEYFFDNLPVKADTDFVLPLRRDVITASTADATVKAPSGASVDVNGYITLTANQRATVTVSGATAGYYDLYLDFETTQQTKYLDVENKSMAAAKLPRFRTRLEVSESGTEAYACTVWLENGSNTLEIYPEGSYGFALRGVKLVNVADASSAGAHIIGNSYEKSSSVLENSKGDTGELYGNLVQRAGDVIVFPEVTVAEDGKYRLYAVGNLAKGVSLTLSTIAHGMSASQRKEVKTVTASEDGAHGTSTSTVLLAINGDSDSFDLSAGTYAFALEASSYAYISSFLLVRVGDKEEEPKGEQTVPENAIDIYKDYLPDNIASSDILEVISSTYIAASGTKKAIYVHKLLLNVEEEGIAIHTIVAHPATAGEYPGVIFIHGGAGKGDDFYQGVLDAAKRGYVAVSYDQPSIAAADCSSVGYYHPDNKYDFDGNPYNAPMYQAVVGGLSVFNLLYTDAAIMDENGDALAGVGVNKDKIGINGISYGGYMTTMLASILGDYVDVAVAKYITGNYPLSEYFYSRIIGKVGSEEMLYEFCKYFDPAAFAENLTAKFYTVAATKDTYGSLPSVITFFEQAVNAERHDFVVVPNQNHSTTNLANGALRTGMCTLLEWNYLHYALTGEGTEPVRVTIENSVIDGSATKVTFTVSGDVKKMSLWYSDSTSKWTASSWSEVTGVVNNGDGTYTVTAPMTTDFTYYVTVELANGDQYSSVPVIVK